MRLVCLPAGVGATLCGSGSGSMVRLGCVSQQARALWSAPPCTHVVPRGRCIANRDRAQAAACRVPGVFRASHRASPSLQPFGWSWRGAATASESEKTHGTPGGERRNTNSAVAEMEEGWKVLYSPRASEFPKLYIELSKAKLASLVALTTMAGYAMAPGTLQLVQLFNVTVGTGLCIASANTINQWIEVPYDAQMIRTRNRALVRNALSPHHALMFGLMSGLSGTALLYGQTNALTAVLGLGNVLLYTLVYTPMKRTSILNTWVGAVVGALPPMMGWAACTGNLDPGAWVLGATLFFWQFPHFNSLSWNLRSDYSKAGYRMMSVTHPEMCRRVALRHSLYLLPISVVAPALDITTWWFAADSFLLNGFMALKAYQFYSSTGSNKETAARQLFFMSTIHLPGILSLFMVHKTSEVPPMTFSDVANAVMAMV